MLNTYIKNRGITQTIVHDKNQNHFNEINWDADYDGKLANISINSNNDGSIDQVKLTLDNKDLANILNIQSVDMPLDKRLMMDFEPETYYIETPTKYTKGHISSPAINEEFIIPLTINRKSIDQFKKHHMKRHKSHRHHRSHTNGIYHRHHRHHRSHTNHRSHKTHKVYKKLRTIPKSRRIRRTTPLISLL